MHLTKYAVEDETPLKVAKKFHCFMKFHFEITKKPRRREVLGLIRINYEELKEEEFHAALFDSRRN